MSAIRLTSSFLPKFSDGVHKSSSAHSTQWGWQPYPQRANPRHKVVRCSASIDLKTLKSPNGETMKQLKKEREERRKELAALETIIKDVQAKIDADDPNTLPPTDYGYKSQGGLYIDEDARKMGPPPTSLAVAKNNFVAESTSIWYKLRKLQEPEPPVSPEVQELRAKLAKLTLSNEAIWERERARPEVETSPIIKGPYLFLCWLLDVIFDGRPIPRFWFLETVARMPYFSYVTMLHGYESLGWWRFSAEVKRVHFAEEWNEFHHLLTMEALGGDKDWADRFFARHSAIAYYMILCLLWLISPSLAYNFSELIEAHAVDTYEQFRDENAELLKTLPPPPVIHQYYTGTDMYMFDEFQTSRAPGSRRPKCRNLYDVFTNIADDEAEHVKTMAECQDTIVASPNKIAMAAAALAASTAAVVALKQAATVLEDAEVSSTLTDVIITIARYLPEIPFEIPFF
eukprot:jgi/Mesvir1/5974/Mv00728-RA.1